MEHHAMRGLLGASSFVALAILCFICIRFYRRRRSKREMPWRNFDQMIERGIIVKSPGPVDIRTISRGSTTRLFLQDLQKATDSFNTDNVIGSSKISIVYKGVLGSDLIDFFKGIRTVAIKILKIERSPQVDRFFNDVVHDVGRIEHPNLINVVAFCWPRENFMALLTEFMPKGDLDGVIHGEPALDLTKRLDIGISTAQALVFLHDISSPQIVHCHLKPTNILLDNDFNARVSDFGTAGMLWPYLQQEREASSSGLSYIAPEVAQMERVSPKADVYSFGVVLMELLSKRRARVSLAGDGEQRMNLREWIECGMKGGSIESLVDPRLFQNVSEREVEKMGHLLKMCLVCTKEMAVERPSMSQVLHWLINIKQDTMERNSGYETS